MNEIKIEEVIKKELQTKKFFDDFLNYISDFKFTDNYQSKIFHEYVFNCNMFGTSLVQQHYNEYKQFTKRVNENFYFYINFEKLTADRVVVNVEDTIFNRFIIFFKENYNITLDLSNMQKEYLYINSFDMKEKEIFYTFLSFYSKVNIIKVNNMWYEFTVDKLSEFINKYEKIIRVIDKNKDREKNEHNILYAMRYKEAFCMEYKIGRTNNKNRRINELPTGHMKEESFKVDFTEQFNNIVLSEAIFKIIANKFNVNKEIYKINMDCCKEMFTFCKTMEQIIEKETCS